MAGTGTGVVARIKGILGSPDSATGREKARAAAAKLAPLDKEARAARAEADRLLELWRAPEKAYRAADHEAGNASQKLDRARSEALLLWRENLPAEYHAMVRRLDEALAQVADHLREMSNSRIAQDPRFKHGVFYGGDPLPPEVAAGQKLYSALQDRRELLGQARLAARDLQERIISEDELQADIARLRAVADADVFESVQLSARPAGKGEV